jgi:FkbM family methyltransferase
MSAVLPAPVRRVLPLRLIQALRSLIWRLPNLDRDLRSGLRLRITNPSDWLIFNEVFVDGDYDAAIDALTAQDRPVEIVDLGANVGYFSLRAADSLLRRGIDFRVTAVEGSPKTFAELQRRLRQPLLEQRARLIHGLVGARQGTASIALSETHFTSSIGSPDRHATAAEVSFVDLEAELGDRATIDLLKCDIEGSEELFLKSYPSLLRKTRAVVLEIHGRACDRERCLGLLRSAGLARQDLLDTKLKTGTSLHHCRR